MADSIDLDLGRHAVELANHEWGQSHRPAVRSLAHAFEQLQAKQGDELNCFDHWMVAFSQPRMERTAKQSFEREGFECWYPIRKVVTTRPLRTLPSKTRHKRKLEVVEKIEPVMNGYLFIRRLRDVFDGNLHDLAGVGGLCHFGEKTATIQDYDVELLRLAEADGKFNFYHDSIPGPYRVSLEVDPRQHTGQSRSLGRLVESEKEVYFFEELGRVLRYVQSIERPAAL